MNNNKRNAKNRFTPLLMALSAVIGVMVGTFFATHFSGNRLNIIYNGGNKLNNLLHVIDDQYVDKVNTDSLVEKAIPQILAELDPHSVYISAADAQRAEEELKGSFSGIGVEFIIQNDTICVQNVIKNGPAEKAGVRAGDKIVTLDGRPFVGKSVTNEVAMRNLKGAAGSKVRLGLRRYGQAKPVQVNITRGEIPTKSVTAAYMLDEQTGYIRIKNFADNTYPEFLIALADLTNKGFDRLVIDLRDNTGGWLQSSVMLANEFLPKGRLIVYTQGRKSPRQDYRSDGKGAYQKIPLVVLINEESASAAEIFAGAMQDNDRATIVGRRSFGKGLVQQPIPFSDGSMIRLTIARYYTPSGRCIQKPYTTGDDKNYAQDILTRYKHGEFFSQDSIKHQGPAYHTTAGRSVYGGGGITPDIFVPEDTSRVTSYYKEAIYNGLLLQYTFFYTEQHRQELQQYKELMELVGHLRHSRVVEGFPDFAAQRGQQRRPLLFRKSYPLFQNFIEGRMVYNMMDEQAFYQYFNQDDPTVQAALKVMREGRAWPRKP